MRLAFSQALWEDDPLWEFARFGPRVIVQKLAARLRHAIHLPKSEGSQEEHRSSPNLIPGTLPTNSAAPRSCHSLLNTVERSIEGAGA